MATFKATANYGKKTFTIRKFHKIKGKLKIVSKFKTFTLNSEQFNTALCMSSNDWQFFLKNNQNYKVIK